MPERASTLPRNGELGERLFLAGSDVKAKKPTTLSAYIVESLATAIDVSGTTPCDLTLASIAEYFKVSLSPVRAAINILVRERYLITLPNGRLALGKSERRKISGHQGCAPPHDYERLIRSDVIAMSLIGRGGFLREQSATERYGIGRTALRPILSQLAGQGLIERIPRRGWWIRPFEKDDLCSFIEVRELLELHALQLARPRLDNEQLRTLLAANQIRTSHDSFDLNNSLHDYWINLSGNRYIQRFFRSDAVYYRTLFEYATPEADLVREMAQQHCEILEALLAKRWTAAKKALSNHIREQKPIVKSLIEKLKQSRT
jgi:DNA-binding GntR family transcriptional regulator